MMTVQELLLLNVTEITNMYIQNQNALLRSKDFTLVMERSLLSIGHSNLAEITTLQLKEKTTNTSKMF